MLSSPSIMIRDLTSSTVGPHT